MTVATVAGMGERMTMRQFHDTVGDDWRVVGEGACAYFRTGSFAAGARLVAAIGELPGLGEHHPDVDVRHAHDRAEERIAAALAAGGRLVTDECAPAYWVLADPEGNEARVCTWLTRG